MFHIIKKNWASEGCSGDFFLVLLLLKCISALFLKMHQCVHKLKSIGALIVITHWIHHFIGVTSRSGALTKLIL
jgi:hypothetical protein